MAHRRHRKNEELMLIPFLDILCSLIGVLVLIIVVLCVAQSQRAKGRTQEELDRSQKYVDALKKQKEQTAGKPIIEARLAKFEELKKENSEKEARLAMLRKLLATSADIKKMNQEMSQNLVKELDNLLVEIEGLAKEDGVQKKAIAALMTEIQKREPPKQKVVPAVLVQPGGSGLAKGAKVFFVEASGGKLTIFWDGKQKTVLSAADEIIATDIAYNYLLQEVLKVPNAKIIFLLRDDGMGSYNKGAGWAQATYGYRTDQIGKLPIPGRGQIDLQMFKEFLGTMSPPPPAPVPAPGTVPTPPKI